MRSLKQKYWPVIILFFLSYLFSSSNTGLCNGYYEVQESGRPRSAFSICCCKKEAENNTQKLYICHYSELEDHKCPEDSEQYNVPALGCPSELIFTKPQSKS